MAIIRRKNGAKKLVNHEAVNDDNSVFEMNPETMEKPHLFRGDVIMNSLLYPTIPFYSQNPLSSSSIKLKSKGKLCCSTTMVKDSRPVSGKVRVIIGPIFAGKSTILLRRIQFEADKGRKMAMIKFAKDTRYAIDSVMTHDGAKIQCLPLSELSMLHSMLGADAYNKDKKGKKEGSNRDNPESQGAVEWWQDPRRRFYYLPTILVVTFIPWAFRFGQFLKSMNSVAT